MRGVQNPSIVIFKEYWCYFKQRAPSPQQKTFLTLYLHVKSLSHFNWPNICYKPKCLSKLNVFNSTQITGFRIILVHRQFFSSFYITSAFDKHAELGIISNSTLRGWGVGGGGKEAEGGHADFNHRQLS